MNESLLAQAAALRQEERFDEAWDILAALYAQNPQDALVNYHIAWWHDAQGKEREAIPYYERAIASGLPPEDQRGAMLGLGSTYRCLGEYDSAIKVLQQAAQIFPEAKEFPVFLAMALYNTGKHAEAMALLLHTLAETSQDDGITRYRRAILFYHDKLDQTWP